VGAAVPGAGTDEAPLVAGAGAALLAVPAGAGVEEA
jgi:hypothetical protein